MLRENAAMDWSPRRGPQTARGVSDRKPSSQELLSILGSRSLVKHHVELGNGLARGERPRLICDILCI